MRKKKLIEALDPSIPRARISWGTVRKVLSEIKIANVSPNEVSQLMALAVSVGLKTARNYSPPEAFFDGIYHMYESLCKYVVKEGLQTQMKNICEELIRGCDIGYGLFEMINVFDNYFP